MTPRWRVRWRRWAAHHRVHAGMLFTLLYIAISIPTGPGLIWGAVLVAAGEGIRMWASGYLEREVRLAKRGPYRMVRHPLYVGSFLIGVGLAVIPRHAPLWIAGFLLLYLAFYAPAMHVEELRLQSIFGPEYQEYLAEVPRFPPRWLDPPEWPLDEEGGRFRWNRLVHNQEHRTVAAMAALLVVQAIKYWLIA